MAYIIDPKEQVHCTPLPKMDEKSYDKFYRYDVIQEDFVMNYGGWARNDIAIIDEQSNIQAAKILLERLGELPGDTSNSGLTDEQILLHHRSRYAQSPSEVQSYIEEQLALRDAQSMRESSDDGSKIKFDSEPDGNE